MTIYPHPFSGHLRNTPEGRLLTLERTFHAAIGDVWASLTEPECLERRYGTVDGELRAGHIITVTMTAEEGPPAEPVHVIECEPRTDSWSRRPELVSHGDCKSNSSKRTG